MSARLILLGFFVQLSIVACSPSKNQEVKEYKTSADTAKDFPINATKKTLKIDLRGEKEQRKDSTQPPNYISLGQLVMTFTIPKKSIVTKSKPLQADIRRNVEDKISNIYPNVDSLVLIHYAVIPKFADYYEYTAINTRGEKVNIFGIKHKENPLTINAFTSETKLNTESRYDISGNTLWVYKQSNYNNETVSISYTPKINEIHFGRDDGFSNWK